MLRWRKAPKPAMLRKEPYEGDEKILCVIAICVLMVAIGSRKTILSANTLWGEFSAGDHYFSNMPTSCAIGGWISMMYASQTYFRSLKYSAKKY
jgi:hypothetical protein